MKVTLSQDEIKAAISEWAGNNLNFTVPANKVSVEMIENDAETGEALFAPKISFEANGLK